MSNKRSLDDLDADTGPSKLQRTVEDKKHSLDSDEEDSGDGEHEQYEIMHDDDIEGQEDGIVGQEGEVKITPFNMKDELEEGHFDTEGNFHWNKEDEVKDSWLDNIDWIKIKERTTTETADDTMDSGGPESPFDQKVVYQQLLEFMQPGETVAKALKRLGGSRSLSASERLKRKKAGLSYDVSDNSGKVTEMTELANRILTKTGNMDVYQESYSHIKALVESGAGSSKTVENSLDMYADDFDEKEKERMSRKETGEEDKTEEEVNMSTKVLMWEYKLDKNTDIVQGPHTTEQMQQYSSEGLFKEEVWVRKVGQVGPYYSSKRVDFELYL